MVPDGDAISETREALTNSKISINQDISQKLEDASREFGANNFEGWRSLLSKINKEFCDPSFPVPVCFLNGDLESSMLSDLSSKRCEYFANLIGIEFRDKNAFIKAMGSKAIDGNAGEGNKQPYKRKQIAEQIEFSELTDNVKLVLRRWLVNAGFSNSAARKLLIVK